jgi:hypothetical protein
MDQLEAVLVASSSYQMTNRKVKGHRLHRHLLSNGKYYNASDVHKDRHLTNSVFNSMVYRPPLSLK